MSEAGRPVVGAIAIVRRGDHVLLAQRSKGGYIGRWGFPGGHVERGETVMEAAMRELTEETGVVAEPAGILTSFDEIGRDASGAVKWHYVLIAVLADWRSGEAVAADDAAGVQWVTLADITSGRIDVLPRIEPLTRMAFNK